VEVRQDGTAALPSPAPLLGNATDPAFSADGRWIAYAGAGGNDALDIWVRSATSGETRRVTRGPDDHREPALSPDGKLLAYRTATDEGGGIYLLRLDGSAPRLLVPGGSRPRFSPDGAWIAHTRSVAGSRPGVFITDPGGELTRALSEGFHSARDAAWSPDGAWLIFAGCKEATSTGCDWWIVPATGGEAVAAGAAKLLREHHLAGLPTPDLWLRNNTIVFAAANSGKTRLWSLPMLADPWRASGAPERLTSGEADERSPAASPDGSIVFAGRVENIDVWGAPLDPARAVTTGAPVRLISHPSIDQRPSLSADGSRMAWETSRGGNFEVWVKNLVTGEERGLTTGPLREHMPALSRDGARLVYDAHDGETVTIFESPFEGGEPRQVSAENVGQGSFQWTAKGDAVLYFHREAPGTVGLLDLASAKRTVLLRHPKFNLSLADARLSPDGRWIAFPAPGPPRGSRLALARLSGNVIDDERDWTYVTPEGMDAAQPEWSPDGRWLYFLSARDGRQAVWVLPLSPQKKPAGAAKPVLEFSGARLGISEMRPRDIGLSVAKDKLALAAAEYTWTLMSVRR
jgi:Tol biopolymer transport system component